jgi:hypothetical protein
MGARRSLIVTSSKCFPISLFSFLIFQSVFSNFVLEPLQSSLLRTPLPHDISLCIVKNDKKGSVRRAENPAAAPERHARKREIWRTQNATPSRAASRAADEADRASR